MKEWTEIDRVKISVYELGSYFEAKATNNNVNDHGGGGEKLTETHG